MIDATARTADSPGKTSSLGIIAGKRTSHPRDPRPDLFGHPRQRVGEGVSAHRKSRSPNELVRPWFNVCQKRFNDLGHIGSALC
jgi:hypothetical protein